MALQEKYINPFTDFGFKKLFGTELNKDLLIDFLNEVILPQDKEIVDLKYRSNEHMGQTELDRKAIFDLYCMSSNGERFIVEMQKAKQNYFKDRSVFYSTFPIQEQAQTGEWNYKLTFIYLEMPHFTKTEEELETSYDKWIYVLKHLPRLTERPKKLQERIFQRLFEAAEIAKLSPEEKEQYEDSLKSYRDLKNVIDTAFGEGERKRNNELAINMFNEGITIELISKITGLSEEDIQRLL